MTKFRHSVLGLVLLVLLITQFYPAVQLRNLDRHQQFKETIMRPCYLWFSYPVAFDSEEKIPWSRKNKEIIIDGEHSDVTAIRKKGKQIILYCIKDEAEDLLLKKFGDWSRHHGKSKKLTALLKWIFLPHPAASDESLQHIATFENPSVKWKESSLIKQASKPESPPPEYI